MVITEVIGGLGNQMFQYAFGFFLSEKYRVQLKVDTSGFKHYSTHRYALDELSCNVEEANSQEIASYKRHKNKKLSLINRIKQRPLYYVEPHFHYVNKLPHLKRSYISGYWQSAKYFRQHRESLLHLFEISNGFSECGKKIRHEIYQQPSVSLHVRRGDYISNPAAYKVHGCCDINYYQQAISFMASQLNSFKLFIFSDDIEWTKEQFKSIGNKYYVEMPNDTRHAEEMLLMSLCQHNIIANSTFSWWAAWLNQNQNKYVVAPKKWFSDQSRDTSDLIPNGWIKL